MKITSTSVTYDDANEHLVVVVDLSGLKIADDVAEVLGDLTSHTIVLHREALANRREGYGLETDAEALDAILREHALRLSVHEPKSADLIDLHGGLDDRFAVAHSKAAAIDRDAVLAVAARSVAELLD